MLKALIKHLKTITSGGDPCFTMGFSNCPTVDAQFDKLGTSEDDGSTDDELNFKTETWAETKPRSISEDLVGSGWVRCLEMLTHLKHGRSTVKKDPSFGQVKNTSFGAEVETFPASVNNTMASCATCQPNKRLDFSSHRANAIPLHHGNITKTSFVDCETLRCCECGGTDSRTLCSWTPKLGVVTSTELISCSATMAASAARSPAFEYVPGATQRNDRNRCHQVARTTEPCGWLVFTLFGSTMRCNLSWIL